MPAAMAYLSDQQSTEYRALEDAFTAEQRERKEAIDKRWAYYRGVMHQPLKIEKDGVNDNVLLPKVGEIADKLRSFLLGEGVQFDTDPSTEGRTDLDNQLGAIWQANAGKRLLSELTLSGIVAGHLFVQVVPREGQPPRLVNVDPRQAAVFWDVRDVARPLWYRLQYAAGGRQYRYDYVRDAAQGGTQEDAWWQLLLERRDNESLWAAARPLVRLDFLPVIDWQNSGIPYEFYGLDDLAAAIRLNDSINLIASDYARILKHHATPRVVGIGFDSSEIVGDPVGGFFTINKDKNLASVSMLEMQSDLKSAFDYLQFLIREAWHSGRMVDPATVKDALGQLTNFGLRVMFHDALAKTADKRELYSEGLDRVCRMALLAAGLTPPERVQVTWPDVLPEDPAMVTTLQAELQAGIISKQTYREIRGYDQEKEEQRLQEESEGEENLGQTILRAFERGGAA